MKLRLLLMLALVMGAALLPRGAAAQLSVTGQHVIWICAEDVDVDPDRNLVYATGCGTVSVIDGGTNTVVATVPVVFGSAAVAVNPATNRIYLVGANSNSVWVMDPATQSLVAEVPVGLSPAAVAVNPTTNLIYVVDRDSDTVSVIDGASNTVAATVPVGQWPMGVAVNPTTNLIYVANSRSDDVSVIDGGTDTVVATVPVGLSPLRVAVNPATGRVYLSNAHSVLVIDGATNLVLHTLHSTPGGWVSGVAVNPITGLIYVTACPYVCYVEAIHDSSGVAPPPAPSPAPPPPTPTACPPAPAPPPADGMEWVPLQCGTCNPNATTYPDNTPIATIAGAVTPPETVESLWGFEGDTWRGWSPRFPAISDLTQVDRLDVVFICVGGSATFTRPTI